MFGPGRSRAFAGIPYPADDHRAPAAPSDVVIAGLVFDAAPAWRMIAILALRWLR